jgi:hypothetical protein
MNRMAWAAIAAMTLGSPCIAAEPWEGVWATEASWCGNKPGETDAVPVTITRTFVEGYENRCDVTKVTRIQRMDAWVLDLGCSGEGEEYSTREVLALLDNGNLMRLTADRFAIEMKPCPPP